MRDDCNFCDELRKFTILPTNKFNLAAKETKDRGEELYNTTRGRRQFGFD